MPVQRLRKLTGRERSPESNWRLAGFLALIAGATDTGGYFAVKQYSSHMSGIVSATAGHSALGDTTLAAAGFISLLSFLIGASCTAILVNWGRRRLLHSAYAAPLMLEAALLAVFGLAGPHLEHRFLFIPTAAILLCFAMGLQNAIITKISDAVIRTTHITGIMTDIGIEFGKLFYWNRSCERLGEPMVCADRRKLALLTSLLVLFFSGGVLGVLAFRHLGFPFTLPLAGILVVLAVVPVLDDLGLSREKATSAAAK